MDNNIITPTDAKNLIAFLDRVSTTGHEERKIMTRLVDNLAIIASDGAISPSNKK